MSTTLLAPRGPLRLDVVPLDLSAGVVDLTRQLCDIESVSGNEVAIADAVEAVLGTAAHLTVFRDGDAVVARTELGRDRRVVIAGHLDTVPVNGNLPAPGWRAVTSSAAAPST